MKRKEFTPKPEELPQVILEEEVLSEETKAFDLREAVVYSMILEKKFED